MSVMKKSGQGKVVVGRQKVDRAEFHYNIPPFYIVVNIGFARDSLTVDEDELSATLTIRVLIGPLAGDDMVVVRFSTEDDSALCMQ